MDGLSEWESAENQTARTLEKKRPMDADFLRSIGMSNGCTVRSSVHSVVVVNDLLRRHCLMTEEDSFRWGGEAKRAV